MAGRDWVEVAAPFKVSARAVDNWWSKWQAGGRDSLLSRSRGRHVGGSTRSCPRPSIRQVVFDHTPCDLGLSGQPWTRGQIGDLIFKLYRVRFN
ncbi:helix-turn-helix domain-containing protein [Streptomyces rubiginosohelvolus]